MKKSNNTNFEMPEGHEEISKSFYDEIWNGNEYGQYGVCVEKGDIVLDCGSNIGIFTDYAIFNGASKVYAFEADQLIHGSHVKNFPQSETSIVKSFNSKVGIGEDHVSLHDIFGITGENHFDFAKLDIEGAEYDLLLKTPQIVLQKIDKWAIEFHLWGYHENSATELKLLMQIIEKFNVAGFNAYLAHIHVGWNMIMFFAEKRR